MEKFSQQAKDSYKYLNEYKFQAKNTCEKTCQELDLALYHHNIMKLSILRYEKIRHGEFDGVMKVKRKKLVNGLEGTLEGVPRYEIVYRVILD